MAKIHLIKEGSIARLRIDNPKKLNALTWAMMEELDAHLDVIERDRELRVLVLDAESSGAFCAGADIDEWSKLPADDFSQRWVPKGHRIFSRMAHLQIPTLGRIDAPVFGGGLELIATLDWRVMGEKVTLALPETSIGIIPGWSGTQRLARLLPEPVLRAMVLFGKRLNAKQADAFGFGEFAIDIDERVDALIEAACLASPNANRLSKMMINAGVGEDREVMIEALGGELAAGSADKFKGVEAFLKKEKPKF